MKSVLLIFSFLTLVQLNVVAQINQTLISADSNRMAERYRILKDSLSDVQPFIPAVSSVIIKQNEVEINFFNSLISANSYRPEEKNLADLPYRQSFFYSGFQFTYGLYKDILNIGIDVNTSTTRIDFNRDNSPLKIFSKTLSPNISSGLIFNSIGPRVRWRPIKNNYKFIVQGSVLFPTYGNSEYKNFVGTDQTYFISQFFYIQPINKKLFLFGQTGIQYGFKNHQSSEVFIIPTSGFLSYLISQKMVLFALANHIQIRSDESLFQNAHTTQIGLGLQYQFSRRYFLNGFFANEIAGKNYNAFDSYSLSMRILLN